MSLINQEMFLFILCGLFEAARVGPCTSENQHTTAYKSCIEDGRPLTSLFLRETYLRDLDPCQPIDNTAFRNLLTSLDVDQPSGFDVEHIIDTSNSIDGYHYIIGNMILSNSSWNRGVGNFCWENVEIEKREVYGEIFQDAYDNVQNCKKEISKDFCIYTLITVVVVIFIIALMFYTCYFDLHQ